MRFLITLFFCLTIFSSVFAEENGTLKGKITDERTGETLVGVTILIPELKTIAAFSDEDGNFDLKVPNGTYTVQVRYMGYTTKEISDVKIENGTITPMTVSIKEVNKTNTLGDVVIRSTLKRESLNALYITQKNSASVSDGISAEAIKKSPDKSTGEVLKRVSGTTIQDNKFVIIRGLSDRYNTALIDNSFLPSTEPNRKAFSFDIIPSSLIDNIVISKSGTPDLPGDFAGGVINILTKEIPDKNFNSISVGSSYNTIATFKNFQTGYKSATDILGFDNGLRQLPKSIPSADYFATHNISQADQNKYLLSLNNNYSINERKALPGGTLQASLGRLVELKKNRRIGLTAALNYGHNETVKQSVQRIYGNYNMMDQSYGYNTTMGGLFNISYSTINSKISLKNLYNRTFDDNFLYREGYDGSSSRYFKYYAFDLIQKSLFKTSLEGEHILNSDAQKKFNWVISYNNVTNNQPDQRKIQYTSDDVNGVYTANIGSLSRINNRLFGNLNESIINAALNYSAPYKLDFLYKSTFKIGALTLYRNRDFQNRYLGAVSNNNFTGGDISNKNIDNLFTLTNINNSAFNFVDQTSPSDKYTAKAMTNSAYIMSDNRFNTRLRAVWGVRLESYSLNLNSPELTNKNQKVNPVWNDFLPSLNMSYALSEKSNLRMSYFRSVARPELREIAPISYYDYELNMLINGNANLTRSRIDNIDLRYEVFPNAGEVFSASLFFKNFDKTIENKFYSVGSSSEIKTINYNSATNAGVELELRKKLDFISKNDFFKNLTFYANLAIIKSSVSLKGDDQKYLDKQEYARTSRPMSGQSPYVINTSIAYSTPDGKLNFNVLYNRIGQRIYIVGGEGQFADLYESPRNILDFQVSWNASKRSEFRLNVKDMLNAPVFFYYDQNANKKFDHPVYTTTSINPYQDYTFQKYRQGSTFSLTYTYRF